MHYEKASTAQNPRVTWEGCSALLDINDGDRVVFVRLTSASTIKIGKKNFSLLPLIGCPFGSMFHVENGEDGPYLSRIISSGQGNGDLEKTDCQKTAELQDNRSLVDNNKAQALTSDDIGALQRDGANGDEIIEALISNSATFAKKTLFSQEKYRRKKQKKYAPRLLLRRPFSHSICEAYFRKKPARTGYLRVDVLSILLCMANVMANSDVLVVDMVGGLLTGAVAERLGGAGYVCNTYLGDKPYPMDIVKIFNFTSEICRRIVQYPVADLCASQSGTSEQIDLHEHESDEMLKEEDSSILSKNKETTILSSEHAIADLDLQHGSLLGDSSKSFKAGKKAGEDVIKLWKENGFSSLIIAAPHIDPWNLIKDLLPLLSYSAPFAIYHQYVQPLSLCMHRLRQAKVAVGLQLSEPWLREYQVLPSRTHPCVQMSATGGFILSGTRICCEEILQFQQQAT